MVADRRWWLVLVVAVALLAAGCSESADPADDAASGDDGTAGSDDGAADDMTGGSDDGSAEPADDAGDDPAGEPLVVSFIITDVTAVAAALGWETPDQGDMEAQIEAAVAWANENGGVGGRPIEPAVRVFNAITDSPISEEQLCNAITQDDGASIVVLTGQFQDNARACYAAAETLMLDVTLFPVDEAGFADLAPYLWSPFLPSYDDTVAGLAAALDGEGWFDGATVGVVGIDSDMNRRVFADALEPRLGEAGVTAASVNWVDPTDGTTLEAGQQQAILDFKDAGVDKVIVIGGSRLASFMMDIGATQNFAPAYAMTSYDSPEFNIRNTPDLMAGAVGISVLPGWDVAEDQYPAPANDAEALCMEIFGEAGLTFESRVNARTGLLYCDAVRLLVAAGADAASTSATDLGAAMWALDDTFESASVYSVDFDDDHYTGSAGYRVFAFDDACSCMVVRGDTAGFDG